MSRFLAALGCCSMPAGWRSRAFDGFPVDHGPLFRVWHAQQRFRPPQGEDVGNEKLTYKVKNVVAFAIITTSGFVVLKDSQAVLQITESCQDYIKQIREHLIAEKTLIEKDGMLVFTKDTEFQSPSSAASVVRGGNTSGRTSWKDKNNKTIKDIEDKETQPEGNSEYSPARARK